jgi:uncharacterized ion transporter superfamily protein YfcC
MKMAIFWVVAPCSLVKVYLYFYQTTWRYNPEDSHLRTNRRENLKSYEQNHVRKPFGFSIKWVSTQQTVMHEHFT